MNKHDNIWFIDIHRTHLRQNRRNYSSQDDDADDGDGHGDGDDRSDDRYGDQYDDQYDNDDDHDGQDHDDNDDIFATLPLLLVDNPFAVDQLGIVKTPWNNDKCDMVAIAYS